MRVRACRIRRLLSQVHGPAGLAASQPEGDGQFLGTLGLEGLAVQVMLVPPTSLQMSPGRHWYAACISSSSTNERQIMARPELHVSSASFHAT